MKIKNKQSCCTVSFVIPPQNQLVIKKTHLNLLWPSTSQMAGLFLSGCRVKLWYPQQRQNTNKSKKMLKHPKMTNYN